MLSRVRTFPTRVEAEMAQGLLRSQGIECTVVSDDAGGAYPFQLSGGAALMVEPRDHDDALRLLEDIG